VPAKKRCRQGCGNYGLAACAPQEGYRTQLAGEFANFCASSYRFQLTVAAEESGATSVSLSAQPRVKNYGNKIYSETNSKVECVVLNALASNAAPASNLFAPAAIHSSSVRAGLAFFRRSRSIWAYRWNALSSTRWEMTAALPPYICAPCDLFAIVFGEADPPTAHIWSARRGETIPLKTRNSRVASRVPGYFF
jgi:hypothetical protein